MDNRSFPNNFHRSIICSSVEFTGKYKYKDVFQLVQPNKSWPKPKHGDTDFLLTIEYDSSFMRRFKDNLTFEKISDEGRGSHAASFEQLDFLNELIIMLTIFTPHYFYRTPEINAAPRFTLRNLGKNHYERPTFRNPSCSPVAQESADTLFSEPRYFGDPLRFPDIIDELSDKYFLLEEEKLHGFRPAMILFYRSIEVEHISPSLSMLCLVSAIEALISMDCKEKIEKCKECKQPLIVRQCNTCRRPLRDDMPGPTKKFREFLTEYGNLTTKDANIIYDIRCKISHAGNLLYYDYSKLYINHFCDIQLPNIKNAIRIAILNWLIRNA